MKCRFCGDLMKLKDDGWRCESCGNSEEKWKKVHDHSGLRFDVGGGTIFSAGWGTYHPHSFPQLFDEDEDKRE
jgi:hypothetical protein